MSDTPNIEAMKEATVVRYFTYAEVVFLKLYKYVNDKVAYAVPYGSMIYENYSLASKAIEKMREEKIRLQVDDEVFYVVQPYDTRRDHSISIPTIAFQLIAMSGSDKIHHFNTLKEWEEYANKLVFLEEYHVKQLDGRHVILNPIGQYLSDHDDSGTAHRIMRHLNDLRDGDRPKRSKQ